MSNFQMDPAFASLVQQPRKALHDAHLVRQAIAEERRNAGSSPVPHDVAIEDLLVSSEDSGNRQIAIRIYRPKGRTELLPALLYLHGGGFFCGDQYTDEWQCVRYAREAMCAVVCVRYRLAPEDPYPAALSDCYQVLLHLQEQRQQLNLLQGLLAVGGSSAGANLAAAVALLARDRSGPEVCFQMLLVPALDHRLLTPSARQFTDVPDFARPEAEVMWRWYLGNEATAVSQYASPAMATDVSQLPAAYILCAGLDPLRDEGINYACRLTEAGVAVELHLVPAIPHGFASVRNANTSQRLLAEQVEVLRKVFHSGELLG